MSINIVTVNVSLQVAPTPSGLQRTGALVSVGGTNTAPNTLSLLTQLSDLTALQPAALALSSLTWTTGVVTATTTAPHGYTNGETFKLTIAGATPTGYNGTYDATVTGASTFTYPHAGTLTTPASVSGTYTPAEVNELLQMATTFFAQGIQVPVYVLELGAQDVADAITALSAYITANPNTIYSFLVPREWDNQANLITLMASYQAPTAKTYFFITSTTGTYTNYTALQKCAFVVIESPNVTALEFSAAAFFYNSLRYQPSNTNKVAPLAQQFIFGVTPYPVKGNGPLLQAIKTAGANVVGTGTEGGISDATIWWGTTKDGNDFTYWYSIDWVQINGAQALANEVINGANDPLNPLDYDQQGINRLQTRLVGVMRSAILFKLATGTVVATQLDGNTFAQAEDDGDFVDQAVVNAVPFVPYSLANPGDYKIGKYAGLSILYIVQRGFVSIILNIVATDFIAQ